MKDTPHTWVWQLRVHMGLTQSQMARRMKVTRTTYGQWERSGTPRGPARVLLETWADERGFEVPSSLTEEDAA